MSLRMILQIFLLAGIAIQIALIIIYAFFRREKRYIFNVIFELGILYYFIILNLSLGFIQITEPKNLLIYPYPDLRNFSILAPILGMPVLMDQHRQSDLLAIICLIFTLPFMEPLSGYWYVNISVFFTALLLIRSAYELKQNFTHVKQNLSRFSMKQAFDTFPEGLAIGRRHGNLSIINTKMRKIMAEKGLTPDKRSSGLRIAFRRMLKEEELQAQQSEANEYTLTKIYLEKEQKKENDQKRLPDLRPRFFRGDKKASDTKSGKTETVKSFESGGRIYRYLETPFAVRSKNYWQILLSDITEESRLITEIRAKNKDLEENNELLGLMLQNVEEIELDKETQRMRNRIHDVMGQRLSILHSSLQQMDRSEEVPLADLLELLEDMMDDLNEEEKFDSEQIFKNIRNTADIVGTQVIKKGDIPLNEEVAGVFLQILREAVTNAIRHGQASKVYAEFFEDQDHYYLNISNTGRLPGQILKEGEGISGMRHKLSSLAGSLEIDAEEEFTIKLKVPHLENI